MGGFVEVLDASGNPMMVLNPLPGFTGQLAGATGDIDGDGTTDVAVTIASGGPPVVLIYDGATGAIRSAFLAFPPGLGGGTSIALADLDGNGRDEVLVGSAAFPFVGVFDALTGALQSAFLAGPAATGVSVAAGDLDGDGRDEIVTGQNLPGATVLLVFNPDRSLRTALVLPPAPTGTAAPPVSVIDAGDGRNDLVVGFGSLTLVLDGRRFAPVGIRPAV